MVENALIDDPTPPPLRLAPLDGWHRALGARMVAFAGHALPVQYDLKGALAERCRGGGADQPSLAHVRDVEQRGALAAMKVLGHHPAAAALQQLVPGEIVGLRPGRQRYTLLLNEAGGIRDDIMVARLADSRLLLVVNASRKAEDFAHIAASLPEGVQIEEIEDRALLALQGPLSATVLGRLAPAATALPFMGVAALDVAGIPCLLSRSGYTGEDGFEISVPADCAEALAGALLAEPEVAPAGLGARDSLRLEAGLCLYGNDIDELTTPIEAGLGWVIGKRRRAAWDFPGAGAIRDQAEHHPGRVRVGLRPDGRAPARAGAVIVAEDGTEAGSVTSGGFSPSLGVPIAMGYVRRALSAPGARVYLIVRGKPLPALVTTLPFVPHRYAR